MTRHESPRSSGGHPPRQPPSPGGSDEGEIHDDDDDDNGGMSPISEGGFDDKHVRFLISKCVDVEILCTKAHFQP